MAKRHQAFVPPPFLVDLLNARSPSGAEQEAQAIWDRFVTPRAHATGRDVLGNRISTLNPDGDPVVMLAGHMDELGLIINHVSKDGFLYFQTIGGHDRVMIPGRRVVIRTRKGAVLGVTGKRAVHMMDEQDRKKVPEIHEMWIDIGAKNRKEALARVSLGDVATYDHGFALVHGSIATARAFDNKVGAYVVGQTLVRLSESGKMPAARLVSVATTQEEIGVRGATTSAFGVDPHIAVAVDVGHATDHPDCDHRKHGNQKLGGGPMICRGPNINPLVFDRLVACAEKLGLDYQLEADPRPTGTDARAIQMARAGVATGLVSIPLRYMHTPSEVIDLDDAEACVKLLVAFVQSLKRGERMDW
jgi:putative aminopeptidase FrvX